MWRMVNVWKYKTTSNIELPASRILYTFVQLNSFSSYQQPTYPFLAKKEIPLLAAVPITPALANPLFYHAFIYPPLAIAVRLAGRQLWRFLLGGPRPPLASTTIIYDRQDTKTPCFYFLYLDLRVNVDQQLRALTC